MTQTETMVMNRITHSSHPKYGNGNGITKVSNDKFIRDEVNKEEPIEKQLAIAFESLRKIWMREGAFSSVLERIYDHSALRSIIELGKPMVPLILKQLEKDGNHWFYALEQITGEMPYKEEEKGDPVLMTQAWLKWASTK